MALSAIDHHSNAGTPSHSHDDGHPPSPNPIPSPGSPTPLTLWQNFTAYARRVPTTKETVFEDKSAKAGSRQDRQRQIFVRSREQNSAVFDIRSTGDMALDIKEFFQVLVSDHPEAVGYIPSKHTPFGVIVAFSSEAARDRACAEGVYVNNCRVEGVPTIDMESTVYQVALDGLPLIAKSMLGDAVRATMGRHGKVLDVKVCTDSFGLLNSKGSVLLDTSASDSSFLPLEHEVHMEVHGKARVVLARWRGMAVHCNYCKKEGHKIADCPVLQDFHSSRGRLWKKLSQ